MERAQGAAIIYCATKEVERLYHLFRERFTVGYYHGGLDAAQRRQLQQQFVKSAAVSHCYECIWYGDR